MRDCVFIDAKYALQNLPLRKMNLQLHKKHSLLFRNKFKHVTNDIRGINTFGCLGINK